jgi:hypothetical protein
MDPNLPWVIAAYALTGVVLVGYALRLRAARRRHLADRQGRS